VKRQPLPLLVWRTTILASPSVKGTRDEPVPPGALSANARLVALVLSTHMDRNGGSCFPSITTLAREADLSRRAVQYALDQIEQAGLVTRVKGGRGKATRYRATSAGRALVQGSQLVHDVHPTSARGAHEDVQESVHTSSTRAGARAGRKKGRANAPTTYDIDPDLLAYDQ
jgi:DNA-binding MarR family transcriptional regulator